MNPVFLFDEIDKMSNDFRGDPASAMLEVLDAEQNNAFRDHYLELPFDLSRVMFITTANTRESIPEPLLDRMEIIEVPSYTEEEKLQIAKRHLVRKEAKEYGIPAKAVRISDSVLKTVIEDYTREAGVRILDRTIGQGLPQGAVDMLETGQAVRHRDRGSCGSTWARRGYLRDQLEKKPMVGVVNGLAYTTVGGEILEVECSVMPGRGNLKLTGQLGDVMKESAQAARSWVRVHADELGLAEDFYKTNDISHPRAGRRGAQGRAQRGRDHHHCHGQRPDRASRAPGCGHDRRDHPAGPRAAHRRRQGKGAGCLPRRHQDPDPARENQKDLEECRPMCGNLSIIVMRMRSSADVLTGSAGEVRQWRSKKRNSSPA